MRLPAMRLPATRLPAMRLPAMRLPAMRLPATRLSANPKPALRFWSPAGGSVFAVTGASSGLRVAPR
jgi:hypothetical protein